MKLSGVRAEFLYWAGTEGEVSAISADTVALFSSCLVEISIRFGIPSNLETVGLFLGCVALTSVNMRDMVSCYRK